jgi:hypothetical protein
MSFAIFVKIRLRLAKTNYFQYPFVTIFVMQLLKK